MWYNYYWRDAGFVEHLTLHNIHIMGEKNTLPTYDPLVGSHITAVNLLVP